MNYDRRGYSSPPDEVRLLLSDDPSSRWVAQNLPHGVGTLERADTNGIVYVAWEEDMCRYVEQVQDTDLEPVE